MIKFISGNFFDFDADIMVNTVNCVGVMGAGVALAFKKRFPDMFNDYVKKCRAGEIRPGQPFGWIQRDMISKEIEIINFPTKNDWKNPSEYAYIEDGLRWLSRHLETKDGKIVTLPALGCGHGGLEWSKVREMISNILENSSAEIYVFEPSDSINATKNLQRQADYESLLSPLGIRVVHSSHPAYPKKLSKYTKRDLFIFPDTIAIANYDFSLICSTKPSLDEKNIILQIMEICKSHGKSVLLGSSAFEKKLSVKFSEDGMTCGCFIPSGIYESVKKIRSKFDLKKPRLLSIGNPVKPFDKKEFLPSVLGRIHLSEKSIFLTERLSWVSKFENFFKDGLIDSYYYNWHTMSEQDKEATIKINAKKLDQNFFNTSYLCDEIFHINDESIQTNNIQPT